MRNELVDVTLEELAKFGLKGTVEDRGKHLGIVWSYNNQEHTTIVARTPSDHRAYLNCRGDVRRQLRNANVQKPPAEVVQFQRAMQLPKPTDNGHVKLANLERDFEALLDLTVDLQTQLALLQAKLSNAKVTITFDGAKPSYVIPAEVVAKLGASTPRKLRTESTTSGLSLLDKLATGRWTSLAELVSPNCSTKSLEYQRTTSMLHYLKKLGKVENGQRGMWRKVAGAPDMPVQEVG